MMFLARSCSCCSDMRNAGALQRIPQAIRQRRRAPALLMLYLPLAGCPNAAFRLSTMVCRAALQSLVVLHVGSDDVLRACR